MTDRELLELAAKAAGIDWCAYFPDKLDSCDLCLQPNGKRWNPLTSDGDALRLAVTAEIDSLYFSDEDYEYCNQDAYAATRRAIVRAAAEIGKGME